MGISVPLTSERGIRWKILAAKICMDQSFSAPVEVIKFVTAI